MDHGLDDRDEIIEMLKAVWTSVLGVDAVATDDDFFDLGGHSLLAVEIAAQVADRTGVELEVEDFEVDRTIAAQARTLATSLGLA